MMTFTCRVTGEDHLACQRHSQAQVPRRSRRLLQVLKLLLTCLSIGVFGIALAGQWRERDAMTLSLALILVLSLSALLAQLWARSRAPRGWLARQGGVSYLSVSAAGLEITEANARRWHAWTDVVAMEETLSHVFLHLRRGPTEIVPKNSVGDPDRLRQLTGLIRTFWAETPAHKGRSLPTQFPAAQARRARWRGEILSNLRAGARLVFFRKVDPGHFIPTAEHLLLLLLCILLLQGGIDYGFALPAPRFDIDGISAFGCSALLSLIGAALVAIAGGFAAGTMRFLLMLTTAQLFLSIPYVLVMDATEAIPPDSQTKVAWIVFLAFMAWTLSIVFRSVRLLRRMPWAQAVFLTSAFALFSYALPLQLPSQSLFYAAQDDAGDSDTAGQVDVESAYYRQPALLKREVDALLPQRPGVTDLYFLGFAGDADENVFAHEVIYAGDLFVRRFHTRGHTMLLVNNPSTIGNLPLANRHNLASALDAIGGRMKANEDLLFLYLSSHGDSDHHLTVQFSPLGLDDLSPPALKAMLDHAGIRYRVVVVSACYSGGFLDVLKDDNSLIITASRRDRTSFGCDADRDFTYFGEAYFRDALNRTTSFVKAYGLARRTVGEREAREGDEPSEPQIFVGKNIARILKNLAPNAQNGPGLAGERDEQ